MFFKSKCYGTVEHVKQLNTKHLNIENKQLNAIFEIANMLHNVYKGSCIGKYPLRPKPYQFPSGW
jgi:hypothetical protein